jgi:hypothetical protein
MGKNPKISSWISKLVLVVIDFQLSATKRVHFEIKSTFQRIPGVKSATLSGASGTPPEFRRYMFG